MILQRSLCKKVIYCRQTFFFDIFANCLLYIYRITHLFELYLTLKIQFSPCNLCELKSLNIFIAMLTCQFCEKHVTNFGNTSLPKQVVHFFSHSLYPDLGLISFLHPTMNPLLPSQKWKYLQFRPYETRKVNLALLMAKLQFWCLVFRLQFSASHPKSQWRCFCP